MVHFYCFIESSTCHQPGTRIFRVKVNDGQRDQIKKTLVDCYATDTNAFFRLWDADTDYWLSQNYSFKAADLAAPNFGLNVVQTDIRTLYRNIVSGTLDSIQNPNNVIRNAFRMMSILSPSFSFKNLSARRAPSVPPVARKNLSVRPCREDNIAAIGFALMALLYWLGSLIGCWERAVL